MSGLSLFDALTVYIDDEVTTLDVSSYGRLIPFILNYLSEIGVESIIARTHADTDGLTGTMFTDVENMHVPLADGWDICVVQDDTPLANEEFILVSNRQIEFVLASQIYGEDVRVLFSCAPLVVQGGLMILNQYHSGLDFSQWIVDLNAYKCVGHLVAMIGDQFSRNLVQSSLQIISLDSPEQAVAALQKSLDAVWVSWGNITVGTLPPPLIDFEEDKTYKLCRTESDNATYLEVVGPSSNPQLEPTVWFSAGVLEYIEGRLDPPASDLSSDPNSTRESNSVNHIPDLLPLPPQAQNHLQTFSLDDATHENMRSWLEKLRSDVGAAAVFIANTSGHPLYQVGYTDRHILDPLAMLIGGSFAILSGVDDLMETSGSYSDSSALHGNTLFQSGNHHECYSATIIEGLFLGVLFKKPARTSSGIVWLAIRETCSDMRPHLEASITVDTLNTY